MEEVKVAELYEVDYSDLLLISSSSSTYLCSSDEAASRIERIKTAIKETLGPNGPGLLSIVGVPNAPLLRRNLLRLSPKLALFHPDHRKRILKDHNLGTDVSLKNPDRNVSSFAMQLNYVEALDFAPVKSICAAHSQSSIISESAESANSDSTDLDVVDDEFKNLSDFFKELGYCMMHLGLCLAQICDKFIGGQELEKSLLESGTAKARLIHYHSVLDNIHLRETARKKGSSNKQASSHNRSVISERKDLHGTRNSSMADSHGNQTDLWQQWHYDYGVFTVLTAPLFSLPSNLLENVATDESPLSCVEECPCPNGYSYLQIFDPNKNAVFMVKTSPESFIIQVGESADILSKGKLQSTLHCVSKPLKIENLSRETFVVFLQPAWSKTFSISDYIRENSMASGNLSSKRNGFISHNPNESTEYFHKIVPPLSSRLRDGMTFSEFSRETTKQYYGGSGLQSNR